MSVFDCSFFLLSELTLKKEWAFNLRTAVAAIKPEDTFDPEDYEKQKHEAENDRLRKLRASKKTKGKPMGPEDAVTFDPNESAPPRAEIQRKNAAVSSLLAAQLSAPVSLEGILDVMEQMEKLSESQAFEVSKPEVDFMEDLFLPRRKKWLPGYKQRILAIPIPLNTWIDEPPEFNPYMLRGLKKKESGKKTDPATKMDHFFTDVQRTTVHMAVGLTPLLSLKLPDEPDNITPTFWSALKKKHSLAQKAARGCNVVFEDLAFQRRLNFKNEFKSRSEWKNLGYVRTIRMGPSLLMKKKKLKDDQEILVPIDSSKAHNLMLKASKTFSKEVELNTTNFRDKKTQDKNQSRSSGGFKYVSLLPPVLVFSSYFLVFSN